MDSAETLPILSVLIQLTHGAGVGGGASGQAAPWGANRHLDDCSTPMPTMRGLVLSEVVWSRGYQLGALGTGRWRELDGRLPTFLEGRAGVLLFICTSIVLLCWFKFACSPSPNNNSLVCTVSQTACVRPSVLCSGH